MVRSITSGYNRGKSLVCLGTSTLEIAVRLSYQHQRSSEFHNEQKKAKEDWEAAIPGC